MNASSKRSIDEKKFTRGRRLITFLLVAAKFIRGRRLFKGGVYSSNYCNYDYDYEVITWKRG